MREKKLEKFHSSLSLSVCFIVKQPFSNVKLFYFCKTIFNIYYIYMEYYCAY